MSRGTTIANNTLLLYVRMLVTMGVGLYTSRVILNSLGISDYGIYNVVGGVVTMFSFLTGSLSTAVSRFLTYSLGKQNINDLRTVFSTSFYSQLALSLIVLLLAEIIAVWFLNTHLNIPAERLEAANWVIQCSIIIFTINIISVPFNAAIIAHERMSAFAYISILEALLKLLVAYSIYTSPFDKLKSYALMLVLVSIIIQFSYALYCKNNFEECRAFKIFDRRLFKEMSDFAGWSLMGNGAYLLNTQGVNIVTNMFFGVTINAARGIADQIKGVIMQFVNNFTTAINPQITKSYASNDTEYLFVLVCKGSKFSYFLLLLFALPILFEAETILKLWLVEYPPYAPVFLRLVLIEQMIDFLGNTTARAVWATGYVKKYYIWVSGLAFLVLPVSYTLFKLGFSPKVSYYVFIVIYCVLIPVRLHILKTLIPTFRPSMFYKEVILPVLLVTLVSFIIPLIVYYHIQGTEGCTVVIILLSMLSVMMSSYFIGLSALEKKQVKTLTINIVMKAKRFFLYNDKKD